MNKAAKCILVVLDGWGHSTSTEHNAIAAARTPAWDRLWGKKPGCLLEASGAAVGLPDGQMGNSEVGHSTLGAGRVLWQSLARLNREVAAGSLQENPQIRTLLQQTAERSGRLHLFGLLSEGGVHSHQSHLHALVRAARHFGVQELFVHAVLDGRDVAPRSAQSSLAEMEAVLKASDYGPIADIIGRYWAMDRDHRWERTEKAWNLYVDAVSEHSESAEKALQQAYQKDQSDEFILPVSTGAGQVRDGDSLLFANFRADRMRQLVSAFCEQPVGFERRRIPRIADCLTMTEYQPDLPVRVAFAPESVELGFAEVLADAGIGQLRIAETEKFAHVTYFFSCGRNEAFAGEKRILIPSPEVATYDLKPQMSAPEITDRLVEEIDRGDWGFALCNFANGDMVGHTGRMSATVAAVECLDSCLDRLQRAAQKQGAHLCITADHGNCESMLDTAGDQAHTAHTANPVPFVYAGPDDIGFRRGGGLADVAPTLLQLMGLEQPECMTGRSLIGG